jgi:hypothetical protein
LVAFLDVEVLVRLSVFDWAVLALVDDAEEADVAFDCPAAKSEPFLLPAIAFVEKYDVSAELDA